MPCWPAQGGTGWDGFDEGGDNGRQSSRKKERRCSILPRRAIRVSFGGRCAPKQVRAPQPPPANAIRGTKDRRRSAAGGPGKKPAQQHIILRSSDFRQFLTMSTVGKVITCKAAVAWGPNDVKIEEIEVAPPKAGEVSAGVVL